MRSTTCFCGTTVSADDLDSLVPVALDHFTQEHPDLGIQEHEVRDYLEHGNLQNAVNFPDATMAREAPFRLAIANANVPDMLGSISHALGRRKINIHNMLNKSKGEMAYTLVDADSPVPSDVMHELADLNGVLSVRYLPVDG
jgi:D-3-phosphoglycerate dehydrogenase / 2-oxoglutarate reductase